MGDKKLQMEYAMQPTNIHILCTRPLPPAIVAEAKQVGIGIDVLPFIETESILSVQVQQEIEQVALQETTVVFTSMNAVDAVTVFLDGHKPAWNIYTLGTTTKKLVASYFGEDKIKGTAADATALAEVIVHEGLAEEVNFFCGDRRRDELPEMLRGNDIDVNEIVVYQTIATAHKVESVYHGILFFSPSAVESFFSINKVQPSTLMFAIGSTTATAINKFTGNKTIVADEPGKENLVEKMIAYFTQPDMQLEF